MRIAQIAPLYERVPPVAYGGTERVVSYLTEELQRLGHDVTLFASGDSMSAARLVPGCKEALRLSGCRDPLAHHIRMLGQVLRRAGEFDIIHSHIDYLGFPLARAIDIPVLTTLHGRLDLPELPPLYDEYGDLPVVSISDVQRQPLPHARWTATVHHGLPADVFHFSPEAGNYLLFLGRISREKNSPAAIRVACRAGVPLRIAAKVDQSDRDYFEEHVKPLLDHPLVEFLGEVDEDRKQELLRGAMALLFPIDWPEPFGLVMIESLACGTPVIAYPRGSVPEILRHRETAWLCNTEEEMVEAVGLVKQLDRRRCRAEFERRFTANVMATAYLDLYSSMLAAPPATVDFRQMGRAVRSPRGRNGHEAPSEA